MNSKISFTQNEADEIVSLIKEKLKADTTKQKGIRAKIRNRGFWAIEYGFRGGYTVANFLSVAKIIGSKAETISELTSQKKVVVIPDSKLFKESVSNKQSDECYVIDLCDDLLQLKALRQHRFDFLRGDTGTRLPVDAWYSTLSLVIEFREKQHTEEVKLFDRRETVSGMGRGEQRKLYDQRRRDILPQNGIKLIEIGYDDFDMTGIRNWLEIRKRI